MEKEYVRTFRCPGKTLELLKVLQGVVVCTSQNRSNLGNLVHKCSDKFSHHVNIMSVEEYEKLCVYVNFIHNLGHLGVKDSAISCLVTII